jgi:small subunit ribosomal protein S16
MATRIRLHRVGRKKQPVYRIVVTDKQKARDGRSVETLGHYHPRSEPVSHDVDVEKARAWLAQGATPSETVRSLLKKAGVFETPAES